MKPGDKITCINNGPINVVNSECELETLPSQPSLVVGNEYTVERVISTAPFYFNLLCLVEEKGQNNSCYSVERFKFND